MILSTGGESAPGGVPSLGGCLVGGAWSGGGCMIWGGVPGPGGAWWRPPWEGYCCEWYASCWNAFLFLYCDIIYICFLLNDMAFCMYKGKKTHF